MSDPRIRDAWRTSTDPVAMVILLGSLHPGRHEETIIALATRLAAVTPRDVPFIRDYMRTLEHRRGPGEAHLDTRSVFTFQSLAGRVRNCIHQVRETRRCGGTYSVTEDELEAAFVTALREAIADPERL